mmetsp:Transcript_34937/g.48792  ORF Transcript_34937/g.48792 Transcript_34937/m.48792 type:complete len:257 (-) Transcript_34937:225-995(-)
MATSSGVSTGQSTKGFSVSYSKYVEKTKSWKNLESNARLKFIFVKGIVPHFQVLSVRTNKKTGARKSTQVFEEGSLLSTYPITVVFQFPKAVFAYSLRAGTGDVAKVKMNITKFSLTFIFDEENNLPPEASYKYSKRLLSKFVSSKEFEAKNNKQDELTSDQKKNTNLTEDQGDARDGKNKKRLCENIISSNNSSNKPLEKDASISNYPLEQQPRHVLRKTLARYLKKLQTDPNFKKIVDEVKLLICNKKRPDSCV